MHIDPLDPLLRRPIWSERPAPLWLYVFAAVAATVAVLIAVFA